MKSAIACYERGKQREVNADDYKNPYAHIHERFICPECGEEVHIVHKKSNYFCHYKKRVNSLDCSLRVDLPSTKSIYERAGLPIYLRKNTEGNYSLFLGFKAIPTKILNQVIADKISITLGTRKYLIDESRFNIDTRTLIPIDYIPANAKAYKVLFDPPAKASLLQRYWPDYSDGFQIDGALFTVTSQGGRRLGYGDIVSTDTEYYWAKKTESLPTYINGIEMHKEGVVKLNDTTWHVFKGTFSSNISDKEYNLLEKYLRESLKVNLLEKQPEFYPLWPPIVKTEDGYRTHKFNSYVHGHISAGNDIAKLYIYEGLDIEPKEQHYTDKIATIPIYKTENVFINIDRKHASNGLSFIKNLTSVTAHSYNIQIINESGNLLLTEYEIVYDRKEISLKCNQKVQIILFKGAARYESYDLQGGNYNISFSNLSNGDCIYILHHEHLINKIRIVLPEKSKQELSQEINIEFLFLWNKYGNTKNVFIPEKTRIRLLNLKENADKGVSLIIETMLKDNRMPFPILRLLEE